MQDVKQKIISVLKDKGSAHSTAEIISLISNDYKKFREEGKYNEARRLHRNVLYHINMLIRERIVKFERFGNDGQKFFIINIGEGEEIYKISPTKYKKRNIGEQFLTPAMLIEGYEQEEIVMKYDPNKWIDRMDSAVIMCEKFSNKIELLKMIKNLFPAVNDSICLENFELIINKFDVLSSLYVLNKECKSYGKKISCIIDVSKVDKQKFSKILEKISSQKIKEIEFIYSIGKDEKREFFGEIISKYAENKKTIYIKNKDKCKSPWFIGKAGIYTFDDKEWEKQDKPTCIGCSQSSVIVDVRKFYENYGFNIMKFTELLMNISKSFLFVNPIQRKKLRSYFDESIHSNESHERDFLELSRNYIRFWNFGLLQPDLDQEKVLDVVEKARERIEDFCQAEDRIFNSCGMAIRFKVVLSPAFKRSEKGLSPAKYRKVEIKGLEDLSDNKKRKEILEIKRISRMFNGGNKINFERIGSFTSKDLANEVSFILDNYRLRFFAYDFKEN